jgi:pilus assembly protein CpaF
MSWHVILPYVRALEPWILDDTVSDILVNGSAGVFIERQGEMQDIGLSIPEKSLQIAVRNIARVLGDEIGEDKPLLDARLPDGSRVAAVFPPCSVAGTVLAIRKFHSKLYTAEELVRIGSLTPEALTVLRDAIARRQNILISGGTGTGKTTLLNALAAYLPPSDRVVVIEDTAEIQLQQRNLVRLEARREHVGMPGVSIRDLLRATLRLRPDRIVLGEVRGGEAFDLLQALNTGHAGTLCTIHANSAKEVISRFTTCVLLSGVELPYRAVRSNIAEALNLLVHIDRRNGQRHVTTVLGINAYDPAEDHYDLKTIYQREAS